MEPAQNSSSQGIPDASVRNDALSPIRSDSLDSYRNKDIKKTEIQNMHWQKWVNLGYRRVPFRQELPINYSKSKLVESRYAVKK